MENRLIFETPKPIKGWFEGAMDHVKGSMAEAEAAKAAATAEAEKARAAAREKFESGLVLADLQGKLGDEFRKVLEFVDKGKANGEIANTDVLNGLVLNSDFKKKLAASVEAGLKGVTDDQWVTLQKVFDVHYQTGDLANFKTVFTDFMVGVAVFNLETQMRAQPHLAEFDGFKRGTTKLSYEVIGFSSTVNVHDTINGDYQSFVDSKKEEVQVAVTAKETQEKGKEIRDQIKKHGGLLGTLFLMIADKKPTEGDDRRSLFEKLVADESSGWAAILGMRGVPAFADQAKDLQESLSGDPRGKKLFDQVAGVIGKSKVAIAEAATTVTGLVGAAFDTWVSGSEPLKTEVALNNGYIAPAAKALKLTLGEGKSIVLGEGRYKVATVLDTWKEFEVKAGDTQPLAPPQGKNEVYVRILAKGTKLPVGTQAEIVDANV